MCLPATTIVLPTILCLIFLMFHYQFLSTFCFNLILYHCTLGLYIYFYNVLYYFCCALFSLHAAANVCHAKKTHKRKPLHTSETLVTAFCTRLKPF